MTRRYRQLVAQPGQLKAQWGQPAHESPQLCYAWGPGVLRGDGNLLHCMLSGKRARLAMGEERIQNGGFPVIYEPSFLEELESRGYDLTTLKFSIRKKERAD